MKYEGPNRYVRIVDGSVQRRMQIRDTQRIRAGGEPASQDRFRGLLRWVQRNESEAAAHGGVHESDRAVRGARSRKMMTTLRGSANGSASPVEYIGSIASSRYSSRKYNSEENLGEVPAIDLVDDQHEQLIRMRAGAVGQAAHRARFEFGEDCERLEVVDDPPAEKLDAPLGQRLPHSGAPGND